MIIYSSSNDISTDILCRYLYINNVNFTRINDNYDYTKITYRINNETKDLNLTCRSDNFEKEINDEKLFYRRGELTSITQISNMNPLLINCLNQELHKFNELVFHSLGATGSLYHARSNNRLLNFIYAKDFGFKIPSTLITTQKTDLVKFINQHDIIITKPINNYHLKFTEDKEIHYSKGTIQIDQDYVESLNEEFGISLFQEFINKKYELRIFVYKDLLFSAAIFPGANESNKLDYRHFDESKPIRIVPYKLNFNMTEKIKDMMQKLNLLSASFDFMVNEYDEIFFLEINTVGMFNFISEACNFNIEKKIAEYESKRG